MAAVARAVTADGDKEFSADLKSSIALLDSSALNGIGIVGVTPSECLAALKAGNA